MDFGLFWSENGYRLCQFWSGIGYGLRGNQAGVYELIYRFNSKLVRKTDKYANLKWNLRIFFCRSNLSNDTIT